MLPEIHSTTVLGIIKDGKAAIAADGQVTMGVTVSKSNAKKVRTMLNGQILAGFAGSAGDAFTLFERFEAKLEQFHGSIDRAAVELAKDWQAPPAERAADRSAPGGDHRLGAGLPRGLPSGATLGLPRSPGRHPR